MLYILAAIQKRQEIIEQVKDISEDISEVVCFQINIKPATTDNVIIGV